MQVYQLVAASRLRDGTSLVDETITPVDGYLDKVVAADRSDDGGRYVKNSMFTNGRPIRTEHMPTVWRRSRILERGRIGSQPADRARFRHETEGKAMNSGPMPGDVYGFVYADKLRSGKALHDEGFEPLDGDWAKVQIADLTDDGGAMPLGPEINIGRRVDPTHMPTAFRYKAPRHQGLRDVMPFLRGTTLVSPAFRDLVERFEPGVHQFLPVAI